MASILEVVISWRGVRLLAEQSYERMLDTEQLAAGWAEGTGHSIHKDVYI